MLTFDHAPGAGRNDKFEIVGSSAYRLRQSRCFIASRNALTCETCHDPHRVPRGEEASRVSAAVCRQCHAVALDGLVWKGMHPAATGCVDCHMPKRRTEDVVHVAMTDHYSARPPSGNLLAELAERHPAASDEYHGEVVPYYPPRCRERARMLSTAALAQVLMKNNLRVGVAELARLVAVQQPRETEWHVQLGDAWLAERRSAQAIAAYERATH